MLAFENSVRFDWKHLTVVPPVDHSFDLAFWRDHLEVSCDDVLELSARSDFRAKWAHDLGPRFRGMLLEMLGHEPNLPAAAAHEILLAAPRSELLEPFFVNAATAGKRTSVLLAVARAALSDSELARCLTPAGTPDRRALAWMVYRAGCHHLELVFHLDRVAKSGFEPRILKDAVCLRAGIDVETTLSVRGVQMLLDHFERDHDTHRESRCAAVLRSRGHHLVFIKRDESRSFISRGVINTFGFRREWIVLDFAPDLLRVRVAATSTDMPDALVDAIGQGLFGHGARYVPEIVATPAAAINAFLEKAATLPDQLTLVELTVRDSPLAGNPKVTVARSDASPVTHAIGQLSLATGTAFATARNVASLKLLARGKRVRLAIVPLDTSHVRVSYSDHQLQPDERDEFERDMLALHGIHILPSTEQRDAA